VAIMPGVRRSDLAIDATRRNQEQRVRIGREITTMRERRGWTRQELARRAGIGRMVESRIERGATNLDLDVLQRIGVALSRPLPVTFWRTSSSHRRTPATSPSRNWSFDSAGRQATTDRSNSPANRPHPGARSTSVLPIHLGTGWCWSNAGTRSAMSGRPPARPSGSTLT
jgi:transcriptional regulator with XRE-family HTH domain